MLIAGEEMITISVDGYVCRRKCCGNCHYRRLIVDIKVENVNGGSLNMKHKKFFGTTKTVDFGDRRFIELEP